jgi:hypothetical protein
MAHRSLRITAAYHALGMTDTDQLINSAHDALNDSVYSYSLGELATVRDPRWYDCTKLFESAMQELDSPIPDPASAVVTLLEFHVVRLVEGLITSAEMLHALYAIQWELRWSPPAKIPPTAFAPLQPFVDRHYVIEELVADRAYREEEALPPSEDDGLDKVYAQVMSMAEEWCRSRWGQVVDPSWLTSDVAALVHCIVNDRAFDRLPILADALQEAGCDDEYILDHLRTSGSHPRCCFAVDLVRGVR